MALGNAGLTILWRLHLVQRIRNQGPPLAHVVKLCRLTGHCAMGVDHRRRLVGPQRWVRRSRSAVRRRSPGAPDRPQPSAGNTPHFLRRRARSSGGHGATPRIRSGAMSTATRASSTMTWSYSSQSSWIPPAAWNTSRSNRRRRSRSTPSGRSSGPISSARPVTEIHFQSRRMSTVTCEPRRIWLSRAARPIHTSATCGSPLTG